MTRADFERAQAAQRKLTVAEMRNSGWHSALCRCGDDGCPGWQAVISPPDLDRRELAIWLKEFSREGLAPRLFGEVGL
ncbi:MAG: hypothetical protein FD189_1111 [Elusimicrobia bacterium]|nr:MAG: hypothetical protein FD189_1111 [Elusimicrobiota bacterium]